MVITNFVFQRVLKNKDSFKKILNVSFAGIKSQAGINIYADYKL